MNEKNTNKNSVISQKDLNKNERLKFNNLGTILIFTGFIITLVCYIYFSSGNAKVNQQIAYTNELQKLTERVEKNSYLAQSANKDAFIELNESAKSIDNILLILKKGGSLDDNTIKIDPIQSEVNKLNNVKSSWESNKALLNTLVTQSNSLFDLKVNIDKANDNNQRIIDSTYNLQKSVAQLGSPRYNMIVQEIILLLNRVLNSNNILFSGENFSLTNGYSLVKDMKAVNQLLMVLMNGSEVYDIAPITNQVVLEHIKSLQLVYYPYSISISKVAENVPTLNSAKELAKIIALESNTISAQTEELKSAFIEELPRLKLRFYASIFGLLVTLTGFIVLLSSLKKIRDNLAKRKHELEKTQANEKAVDELREQVKFLAADDLTKEISNSDKYVKTIADPVESLRKHLRNMVFQIKGLSGKVKKEGTEIVQYSKEVLQDADNQHIVINNSLSNISDITNQMEDLAQNTYMAQEEAKKSEEMSNAGLIVVNKSIEKMNSIRDNIQESSKKIKRLGESSQSIVEVTNLIRSITKEINALAFNAAIEATQAGGETGKAFSIMATQVQRLAVNSGAASKEIDDLIKNIQEDTASAVASMEETTQHVVDGTKLNNEAGYSLREVAKSSSQISQEISIIAETIENKSTEMIGISTDMT